MLIHGGGTHHGMWDDRLDRFAEHHLGSRDVEDIRSIVARIAQEAPEARKVIFEGAGHLVNLEQPDEFNRVVLAFLAGSSSDQHLVSGNTPL